MVPGGVDCGDSSEVGNIVLLICANKMGMKIDMDYGIDPGVMDR